MSRFTHVGGFADKRVSVDLYEYVYSIPGETDDCCIMHEFKLDLDDNDSPVLSVDDVLSLAKVLQEAMECAKGRTETFYDEELTHA